MATISWGEKWRILGDIARGLRDARRLRAGASPRSLQPEVPIVGAAPPEVTQKALVWWSRLFLACLLFWVPRRCLYRSMALARVLRARGVAARVNIGLRERRGRRTPDGHCWISLHGRALAERGAPEKAYPVRLAEDGDFICYWLASSDLDKGERLARLRS
jgi:hypothetical protein